MCCKFIKVQLEEQMAGFFKAELQDKKNLKVKLSETRKKLETVEERFVIGEINRRLYDKFKPKYEKECFEIETELNKVDCYSSNLKNVIKYAVDLCQKPTKMWDSCDLAGKRAFQKLLFPEGVYYNRELDRVRTARINSFFSPIPEISKVLGGNKKGDSIISDKIPALVILPGFEPRSQEPESCILSIEL